MKILVLSPLFPPDVGSPAPYVKELLYRLRAHEAEALIYGYLPESVPGVSITAIDKRTWVIRRLISYTRAIIRSRAKVDLIILNNAPSTELPMFLVSLFTPNTIVLCESDPLAYKISNKGLYTLLHKLTVRYVKKIVVLPEETLYKTPEKLPYNSVDSEVAQRQDAWWTAHIKELTII